MALMLLGIQRQRGLVRVPASDPVDVVLVLGLLGAAAEIWDTATATRVETAAECFERARREPAQPAKSTAETEAAVREVIAGAPPEEQPALWERHQHRHDNKLRLEDWMRRMPGTWIVGAIGPESTHWVAIRDHALLIDDDSTWLDRPLFTALRILTRESNAGLH